MDDLKARLNNIVETFQEKFQIVHNDIQHRQVEADETRETTGSNVDSNLELHLAIAIYLATYTDFNDSTRNFFGSLEGDAKSLFFEFLQTLSKTNLDARLKEVMEPRDNSKNASAEYR